MRRARFITALTTSRWRCWCSRPTRSPPDSAARASTGETTDKVITNAMFLVIMFFPTVIIVFSLIQWRLEKRKHARMDAAKRRAANADWRGGW